MDILQSSYLVKFINKIDLSNSEHIEASVRKSFLSRVLRFPLEIIQHRIKNLAENSLIARYADHLLMANLIMLLIAITFSSTTIQGLLVASALAITFLKWLIIPEERHNFTIFDIPVSAYIAVALISTAFSSYFIPSAKGLSKLITYFAVYIVGTNLFKGQNYKIYFILIGIAITGGLESLYGIYQKFSGVEALATWQDPDSIMAGREMSRVYGTLEPFNPNLLAGYLLPVFPCALGLGAIFAFKKHWFWSLLFTGLSLTTMLCIVFTGSRGAYIGVVLMGVAIYLLAGHLIWHNFSNDKYSKYYKLGWIISGIAAIAVIILAIIAVPALHDRIMSIFTLRGNSSNSFRVNVYLSSIEMFKDNWLIGIGIGNTVFRLVYGLYMVTGFDALGAYSVPLEIAVEMGVIGLLAFLWMLLVFFSNALKRFNSTKSLELKLIIASIVVAFIGIGGQGVFDTIWYRPQVHIIFWLLVAILACIVSRKVSFKDDDVNSGT